MAERPRSDVVWRTERTRPITVRTGDALARAGPCPVKEPGTGSALLGTREATGPPTVEKNRTPRPAKALVSCSERTSVVRRGDE